MLNQLLTGRYKVLTTLGEGGLGKTYVAEDLFQPSHPQCVVKLLKPGSKDSSFLPIARRLFQKEAEILEQLGRHPQIPQLLAHFEQKKEFLIVQEFIAGHTLSAELPVGHCWSENKVVLILQDVLQILEYVHSYGVIHRDIKPNNLIRRDKDGKLVLIDFGAVKQVSDPRITTKAPLTPKTIAIGTQGYMPTEQARGKPRLNSDIYALGMIAIQALTGIDPINLEEDREGEVIWKNYARVNDELASILSKMVRYHFRDRYQSVSEVLQALKGINVGAENPTSSSLTSVNKTQKQLTPQATKVSFEPENFENEALLSRVAVESDVSSKAKSTSFKEKPNTQYKVAETKISLPNKDKTSTESAIPVEKPSLKQASKETRSDAWSAFNNATTENISAFVKTKSANTNSETRFSDKPQGSHKKDLSTIESSSLKLKAIKSESIVESRQLQNTTKITQKDKKSELYSQNNKKEVKPSLIEDNLKETKVSVNLDEQSSRLHSRKVKTNLKNNIVINKTVTIREKLDETKVSIDCKNNKKSIVLLELIEKIKYQAIVNNLPNLKLAIDTNSQLIERKINSWVYAVSQLRDRSKSKRIKSLNPILNEKKKPLLIGLGASIFILGSYNIYNYSKQKETYLKTQKDLEEIKEYYQERNYQLCIESATEFTREFSDLSMSLDNLLPECYQGQLGQAEKLASESRLKDAIFFASQIPENSDIYAKTKQLISLWSEQIYKIANNKYQEGKLDEAIAIAQAIPPTISIASKVEVTIQQWNQEWQQNQTYLLAARQKLDEGHWQEAIDTAKKISDNAYWQKESKAIVEKAETEIATARNTVYSQPSSRSTYRPKPVYRPRFIPGVSSFKNLPVNPNHPINNPNRDWVKEKLGRE